MPDFPVKADIKVDATQALNTLSEGCKGGIGMLLDCFFIKWHAKKKAEASNIEAQAEVDNDLIRHGLARKEKSELRYTVPEEQIFNYLQTGDIEKKQRIYAFV